VSLLEGQKPFLETNAWQKPKLNSLRYNTSQVGSVLPIVFGTTRLSINLIALGDYRGPGGGKKGKNGPLPLGGTSQSAKGKGLGGGGGKKGAGGKKSTSFSVDVAFALAQGPIDIKDQAKVWSSAGVAFFQSVGLNLYTGEDGQAPDPVFLALDQVVGYSGTCYVTGTPMDLGASPVLPNLSFEMTGFETGTAGPTYIVDANPANVVERFLTDSRWGAGWPTANLDPNLTVADTDNYGDYCAAAELAISVALQSQTDAATYISELARLTNTAIVWSGTILKFIPYGDLPLTANSATWTPNLTPEYSFTNDDFLPWNPKIDTEEVITGEDDPVIIHRANPADAINWMSMEYLDRENDYDKTLIPQFDQGSIDLYGVKTEPAIQGNCFCDERPATISLRLLLQRELYARNTYEFQVGWKYSRLEQMDIVLLTDVGLGLNEHPVRVLEIKENENGDLAILAEEIKVDVTSPPPPIPEGSIRLFNNILSQTPILDTTPSAEGTLSVWMRPDTQGVACPLLSTWETKNLVISTRTTDGKIGIRFAGSGELWEGFSGANVVLADSNWHHFICAWDTQNLIDPVTVLYDGVEIPITSASVVAAGFNIDYDVGSLIIHGDGGLLGFAGFYGGTQDFWFLKGTRLDIADPAVLAEFRNSNNTAVRLGANGEGPTGSPPTHFHRADYDADLLVVGTQFNTNLGSGGATSGPSGPMPYSVISSTPYDD
jgi:hypothetical protein